MKPGILLLSVLFFFILLFSSCSRTSQGVNNETRIRGKIMVIGGRTVYFNIYASREDLYQGKQSAVDSAIIDDSGIFTLNPDIDSVAVFTLQYDRRDIIANGIIRKGDQVDFRFSGKDYEASVESKGEASEFNAYLLRFMKQFYREERIRKEFYVATNYMEADAFEEYSEKRRRAMLGFYEDSYKDKQLDLHFVDYALYTINYEFACDRLMFIWKRRMKGEPVSHGPDFFAFITPSFLENAEAFISPSYVRFINLYLKDRYEQKVAAGEYPPGELPVPAVEKYKLARQIYKDKSILNAVLINLIISDMHDVSNRSYSGQLKGTGPDSLVKLFESKYGLMN